MSGFETRAVHVGQEPDQITGAVVPPIHLSTTFIQDDVGSLRAGYDYGRAGTPTRTSLEQAIASLEQAEFGYTFGSGLAAIDAVLRLIGPNDHVIIPSDVYGGTFRLIDKVHRPHGLEYTAVDLQDLEAVEAAWRHNTRILWVETPTNPTLSIVDIAAMAEIAHANDGLLVVDNTFASPYLQQPLTLGADVVVHSLTKYLGGHSDVVGGFVALDDAALAERVYFLQKAVGAVLSPFDCYLVQRGIKTLAMRVERQCDNAELIVDMLTNHPTVKDVLYPGLPSHSNHQVAAKQMKRYGAMVSFVVHGGQEVALRVARSTKVFTLGESLGAVESLIEHPGRMTHSSTAGTTLEVDSALVRLSVGVETSDDLIEDLRTALDSASTES